MTIKPADHTELCHIRDGGSNCLDRRKERRLLRLGYIESVPDSYGVRMTLHGLVCLAHYEGSTVSVTK